MGMPRILISGYYGFDNLGDDTVLFGILSAIRKLQPESDLAVLSNQPSRTEELFGIPAFNRWNGWTIFQQLTRSDMLVMGGGSLLQDVTGPRSILYYLGIVAMAKMLGKPVVFYAQGVGPITKPLSKRLIEWVVNRVDLITVRDDKSKHDLQSFGVRKPPVHVTADPALAIDTSLFPKEHGVDILSQFGAEKHPGQALIGVAIRSWSTTHPYLQELATACDRLVHQGNQIVFLPMQYPGDVTISQEVRSLMSEPSILLDRQFSFRDIASTIANFDMIIGMRLHSLILAALFDVPFVPLSYDPKIDRFVHRLGFDMGQSVHTVTADLLTEQATQVLASPDDIRMQMRQPIQELRQEAEKNGRLAFEVLKGCD